MVANRARSGGGAVTTALTAAALLAALHATPSERARALTPLVTRESHQHHIPRGLLSHLVAYESRFRYWVVSPRGAVGLGQIHRPLPAWLGAFTRDEIEEPATNLHLSALMLAAALARCHGRIQGALHAYNFGHGCGPSAYARNVMAQR